MDGKALVIVSKQGTMARLQLPYEPPEEYDLEVRCKRTGGEECFGAGLVAGGNQVLALVDGWPPQFFSGFELVDDKGATDNPTTVKGQKLKSNVDLSFTYSVRAEKIETALNGKVVASFRGEFNRLALREGHRVPNKKALFLFTAWEATYQFDRIVVTPVMVSPCAMAHWIGAAPRYFGKREACTLMFPRRGRSIIHCGTIRPYPTTIIASGRNASSCSFNSELFLILSV